MTMTIDQYKKGDHVKYIRNTKRRLKTNHVTVKDVDSDGHIWLLSNGMEVRFVENTSELWNLYESVNYSTKILVSISRNYEE